LLRDDQVFLEYTPSTKMDSSKIERIEECYVLFVKSEGSAKIRMVNFVVNFVAKK
jgi:hypothetical protein